MQLPPLPKDIYTQEGLQALRAALRERAALSEVEDATHWRLSVATSCDATAVRVALNVALRLSLEKRLAELGR
jgi:hypothetical protein